MNKFYIRSTQDNSTLFEGNFNSFRDCLEQAVDQRADLRYADLRHHSLINANLDDARLPCADLSFCNLSGANLSECDLGRAKFCGASLYNTCMAYSDLTQCDFQNADFGATDITGCDISGAVFSTLSCFSLNFSDTDTMNNCRFKGQDGRTSFMSRPPVVITGLLRAPVIMTENDIRAGHKYLRARPHGKDLEKLLPAIIKKQN